MNALALGMPGMPEMIIIAVIALLIFGRRLPDVARSVGKSIVEFKKGLREVKDEMDVPPRIEPPRERRLDANASGSQSDSTGPVEESKKDHEAAGTATTAETSSESDG